MRIGSPGRVRWLVVADLTRQHHDLSGVPIHDNALARDEPFRADTRPT